MGRDELCVRYSGVVSWNIQSLEIDVEVPHPGQGRIQSTSQVSD